jgi:hypothetical protein
MALERYRVFCQSSRMTMLCKVCQEVLVMCVSMCVSVLPSRFFSRRGTKEFNTTSRPLSPKLPFETHWSQTLLGRWKQS